MSRDRFRSFVDHKSLEIRTNHPDEHYGRGGHLSLTPSEHAESKEMSRLHRPVKDKPVEHKNGACYAHRQPSDWKLELLAKYKNKHGYFFYPESLQPLETPPQIFAGFTLFGTRNNIMQREKTNEISTNEISSNEISTNEISSNANNRAQQARVRFDNLSIFSPGEKYFDWHNDEESSYIGAKNSERGKILKNRKKMSYYAEQGSNNRAQRVGSSVTSGLNCRAGLPVFEDKWKAEKFLNNNKRLLNLFFDSVKVEAVMYKEYITTAVINNHKCILVSEVKIIEESN